MPLTDTQTFLVGLARAYLLHAAPLVVRDDDTAALLAAIRRLAACGLDDLRVDAGAVVAEVEAAAGSGPVRGGGG